MATCRMKAGFVQGGETCLLPATKHYVGNSRFFKILSVQLRVGYSETSHALFSGHSRSYKLVMVSSFGIDWYS